MIRRPPRSPLFPYTPLFRSDLARRKLLPGLTRLSLSALAPDIRIVGTSLEDRDDESFRQFAKAAVQEFGSHKASDEQWEDFACNLHYVSQSAGPEALAEAVTAAD